MEPETPIDDAPNKSFFIFGRDISQVPCFRNSFLYGIGGGVVASFTTFTCTSKPRLGMHVGMGTFTLTTILCWCNCRYKFSQQKFEYDKIQRGMANSAIYEGTDIAEVIAKSSKRLLERFVTCYKSLLVTLVELGTKKLEVGNGNSVDTILSSCFPLNSDSDRNQVQSTNLNFANVKQNPIV